MTLAMAKRLEEMKQFAAELEQGLTTWENECGYVINDELSSILNLPTEGEYV